MIERLPVGSVTCDYVTTDTFKDMLKSWLNEGKFRHVVTLNPEMVMAAETDTLFRDAVRSADIRVPDGAGLIWAQWYIRSQFWSLLPSLLALPFRAVERVTGVATVNTLAELCARTGQPLYLLGGDAPHVTRTAEKLKQRWPKLTVFTSPDHVYDSAGPASILDDIRQHSPAVLLVAYGAPKQTIWIERHRKDLPSVRIAVGVGGAFAILSEARPRAPQLLQRFNLEWLWRLILEPSRLPRIYRATVQFPMLIARQKQANPPLFSENIP